MKEQTTYDYEKYVQIAQMAKMGWWESDLKNKEYICSDFIVDLLGLESNRISFTEFHQRIREDHRLRLKNEYMSLSYLETYEQMFPIRAKDGEIWVYSKINFQKPDKEGYRNMTGFLQYIDRPIDTTNGNIDFFQVSNLLYQQTNISYSLLAFLQCDAALQYVKRICTVCCQSAPLCVRHAFKSGCKTCCGRMHPGRDSGGISCPKPK